MNNRQQKDSLPYNFLFIKGQSKSSLVNQVAIKLLRATRSNTVTTRKMAHCCFQSCKCHHVNNNFHHSMFTEVQRSLTKFCHYDTQISCGRKRQGNWPNRILLPTFPPKVAKALTDGNKELKLPKKFTRRYMLTTLIDSIMQHTTHAFKIQSRHRKPKWLCS